MQRRSAPERLQPSARSSDQYRGTSFAPSSWFSLPGCFSLGRFLERRERFVPESIEPTPQNVDPALVDRVESPRALRPVTHEARCFEDSEVLGNGWTCDVHPIGDFSH